MAKKFYVGFEDNEGNTIFSGRERFGRKLKPYNYSKYEKALGEADKLRDEDGAAWSVYEISEVTKKKK